VLRTDYVLDEGEKLSNMKFLLGIKVSENVSKGTIIYKQRAEDDSYYAVCRKKWKLLLSQSPIETYRVNKRRKDILRLILKLKPIR
jgi:hypothetical protein